MAGRARTADRAPAKKRKLRSLKVSAGFKSFVLDQLEEVGDVTPRAMFGGVGLYHAGVFFGILAGDTLYLKVDDSTLPDYKTAGMAAFNPYAAGTARRRSRPGGAMYYAVPLDVLESAPELAVWARKAIAVATSA